MTEGHDQDLEERTRTTEDDRPRSRGRLATVLALLCVLALAGGIALMFWLQNETDEREAAEDDRIAAMQAAARFTEEWNTFRPSTASTYVERVSPLLTSRFRAEFENAAADVVTGITQGRLLSKGEVLETEGVPIVGIASIDPDSAKVLVVADAPRVSNGQRIVRHWRWEVSLEKVDGEWLVDEFKDV